VAGTTVPKTLQARALRTASSGFHKAAQNLNADADRQVLGGKTVGARTSGGREIAKPLQGVSEMTVFESGMVPLLGPFVTEEDGQGLASPGQTRLDSSDRHAGLTSHLIRRQVAWVMQDDRTTLVFGYLLQRHDQRRVFDIGFGQWHRRRDQIGRASCRERV